VAVVVDGPLDDAQLSMSVGEGLGSVASDASPP
jgi:hypothetical protein